MSRLSILASMHANDAGDAAWEAYLSGVPMSWLVRQPGSVDIRIP